MIWPWDLGIWSIPYWVVAAIFWRGLTGHFAWSVHLTSTDQRTIKPPVENWIASSIPCAMLALLWPFVLLFIIPWPGRGAEQEGEIKLKQLRYKELVQSNADAERHLQIDRGE